MPCLKKTALAASISILLCSNGFSQKCNDSVHGVVKDGEGLPVAGAIVRLKAGAVGTATDSSGYFLLEHLCPGKDSIAVSSLGFKTASLPITVVAGKEVDIVLQADYHELSSVSVAGERLQDIHSVAQVELSGQALEQVRGASLGEALKDLPGISAFQTGPTLFKPEIHGLYSNNILIMNDGVAQEGQQWGSEHAPEIDPFGASGIAVIKGAASVRYGSDAVGGVILLKPAELPVEPGIGGSLYLIGESNGKMGIVSGTLEGAFGKKL